MRQFRPLSDQRGNFLMQALVAVAILGVVTGGFMSMMEIMNRMNEKTAMVMNITVIRDDVKAAVVDGVSWQNTINDNANTSLACLRTNTDCRNATGAIQLRDRANAIMVSSANTAGYTAQGTTCNTYGTGNCSLKLNLTWTALCPADAATPCTQPGVHVIGDFQYTGRTLLGGINLQRLQMNVVRDQIFERVIDTINRSLAEVGNCPSGQAATGFSATGQLNCGNFASGSPSPTPTPTPSPCQEPPTWRCGCQGVFNRTCRPSGSHICTANGWSCPSNCQSPSVGCRVP